MYKIVGLLLVSLVSLTGCYQTVTTVTTEEVIEPQNATVYSPGLSNSYIRTVGYYYNKPYWGNHYYYYNGGPIWGSSGYWGGNYYNGY
ncbi:MAG: hypothetical protein CK426_00400 [Legionella sp.]|nr:MAG: hypothetical protein CK423_09105 [Legionella sp.]PJE00131.1 MAG: hypothetical protein CK426_00400 [Legionella sp.]